MMLSWLYHLGEKLDQNGTKVKAIVTREKSGWGWGGGDGLAEGQSALFCSIEKKKKERKKQPLSGRVHDEDLKYIESQGFA